MHYCRLLSRRSVMADYGKALKRAVKVFAETLGPGEFAAGGKQVVCPHCGMTEFAEGSAQLNTAGMTFVGLDWANRSAATLACMKCGCIQWFLQRPERI
jgi:predicted nucleic-acid-binding Zn-ribbon protein